MRIRSIFIAAIMATGVAAFDAEAQTSNTKIQTTSPNRHEPIKARILNPDPKNFTIDVEFWANRNANENAPTFAIYTGGNPPKLCADFTNLNIPATKSGNTRTFDLSRRKPVLEAIENYGCVAVKNIPAKEIKQPHP
jgi:hypothetical protein